jgi:hypothetical protein
MHRLMKVAPIAWMCDALESWLSPVNICQGRRTLSGTPDPAEAGTPDLHDLRGRCLDHEQHDMNETRETAHAGMQQAIPGFDGGYRLRQGGRFSIFFTKKLTK